MKQLPAIVLIASICLAITLSCQNGEVATAIATEADKKQFIETLEKHLNAVSSKDLAKLESTLPPDGKYFLMLPRSETTSTSAEFLKMHEEWFTDTTWTFQTKIVYSDVGVQMGLAIVDVMYQEPDRNGQPYFNKMVVSYTLKKFDGKWYVATDHASSLQKTGDN